MFGVAQRRRKSRYELAFFVKHSKIQKVEKKKVWENPGNRNGRAQSEESEKRDEGKRTKKKSRRIGQGVGSLMSCKGKEGKGGGLVFCLLN